MNRFESRLSLLFVLFVPFFCLVTRDLYTFSGAAWRPVFRICTHTEENGNRNIFASLNWTNILNLKLIQPTEFQYFSIFLSPVYSGPNLFFLSLFRIVNGCVALISLSIHEWWKSVVRKQFNYRASKLDSFFFPYPVLGKVCFFFMF